MEKSLIEHQLWHRIMIYYDPVFKNYKFTDASGLWHEYVSLNEAKLAIETGNF